ncbi:MAG: hypothetical protein GX055_07480 [Desulfovibrionales bacterium]|nr:hypothetical protein [Desulfovibrionales bacterium]
MLQAATLRPLREDIDIHPAPAHENGLPRWTLHDITGNRFFSVGLEELRILKHWSAGSPEQVAQAASAESPRPIAPKQVEDLANFLAQSQLLQVISPRDTQYLLTLAQRREQSLLKQALHTYLSVRIPLVRPQRLLRASYPLMRWVFSPVFLVLTVLAGLCGAALVSVRWDEYTAFLPDMFTPSGMVAMLLALAFAKTLHEFGHAYTATRHGCRVAAMGIAFIVGCPMLYTDATEAWKLPSHRARLYISLAGLGAEFILAAWALLFWNLVEPGHLRDALFLFSAVTWLVSVAINISPFMRFDGYYLLMDLWGIPNLQPRAFALATWKLRGLIFDLSLPSPDSAPEQTQRLMIVYAVCTWLYRFFLFLGIAWLVYIFFFKVLGVILMAVELGWFIALPIWREIRAWHELRKQVRVRPRAVLLFFALAGIILFMPWPRTASMPAVLQLQDEVHVYAPHSGQVTDFAVQIGDQVRAGERLLHLQSPELERNLASSQLRLELAEKKMRAASLHKRDAALLSVLREELRVAHADVHQRQSEMEQLTMTAPRQARVIDLDQTVHSGSTVALGQELLLLATPDAWEIHALAESDDFARLAEHQSGRFVPETPGLSAVPCILTQLDTYADRSLDWPLLSAAHGGLIATTHEREPMMQTPRHRVLCQPQGPVAAQTRIRGVVLVRVWTEPLAWHAWTKAQVFWERELGF